MFVDRDVVCISPIKWDFHRQRHQIFMTALAAAGNRVYYLEGMNPSARPDHQLLRKVAKYSASLSRRAETPGGPSDKAGRRAQDNRQPPVTRIRPLIIPGRGKLSRALNDAIFIPLLRRRLLHAGVRRPVVWTYLATRPIVDFTYSLDPAVVIYDTVFDARLHPDSPADIAASENELTARADLVLTDNRYLFDRCLRLNPRTHIIKPGVDFERYTGQTASLRRVPFDAVVRPRICFFGGVTNLHIDVPLIAGIARERPDWQLVFFGTMVKISPNMLRLPNIHLYPACLPEELPGYLNAVDVILIPNAINDFSLSIFPAKTYECLATGKPIVAADIPELRSFDDQLIRRGRGVADFIRLIGEALAENGPELARRRRELAAGNTWTSRLSQLDQLISEGLDRTIKDNA